MNRGISQKCSCSRYGQILTLLNISVQEQRNPLRVAEVVQESSTRNSEIVPGHLQQLPGAEGITPIIYVLGGQAELLLCGFSHEYSRTCVVFRADDRDGLRLGGSNPSPTSNPLSQFVPLAQGIAFFKKRDLQ
jgi:hypothetical protein